MAKVELENVRVLNREGLFSESFQFEITFKCIEALEADLEWRLVYVGSAESEEYDQVLDTILVGPVNVGLSK